MTDLEYEPCPKCGSKLLLDVDCRDAKEMSYELCCLDCEWKSGHRRVEIVAILDGLKGVALQKDESCACWQSTRA